MWWGVVLMDTTGFVRLFCCSWIRLNQSVESISFAPTILHARAALRHQPPLIAATTAAIFFFPLVIMIRK